MSNFPLIFFLVFCSCINVNSTISSLQCTDGTGKVVDNGEPFFPKKEDPCLQCICDNGQMVMCRSVSCSPPKTCINPVPIDGKCCEFHCGEGDGPVFPEEGVTPNMTHPGDSNVENTAGTRDSITTLGLRLVASTVTSFLVLALLLFMIHRLRQKRLLQAMRRYRNNQRRERLDEMDADTFNPEFLGITCPPYEDPPPPYSPPKPHNGNMPNEAPPPYEMIDSQNNNEAGFTPPRSCDGNHSDGANNYSPRHANDANFLSNQNGVLTLREGRNYGNEHSGDVNGNDADAEVASIMTGSSGQSVMYNNNNYQQVHPNRVNQLNHVRNAPNSLSCQESRNQQNSTRNRSEPRYSGRTNTGNFGGDSCVDNNQRVLDYDFWDESSTATSQSDCRTCQPSRRRSYQENYTKTFDRSIPPYLSLHLDLDDTSTEMSSNVTGYNPVCHHRYGSLPANSSFSVNSSHGRSLSHDGSQCSSRNRDNRRCVGEDCNTAVQEEQTSSLPCVSEDRGGCEEHEEFDVSVSNISGSNQRPVCDPDSASATNVLENDSVLAMEDRNRKLEQIYDLQKLRILRLTKLLQNPHSEEFYDPSDVCALPTQQAPCSSAMCRSQSQHSSLSVCSETGEKKMSSLVDSAIDNDAQYPENAICRHPQPLGARLMKSSYVNGQRKECDSNSSGRASTSGYSSFMPGTGAVSQVSQTCNAEPSNHACSKGSNRASSLEKQSTSEKVVQTDKKLLGKLKNRSRSQKGEVGGKKKRSKSEGKGGGIEDDRIDNIMRRRTVYDTDVKSYGFIDELKSVHRLHPSEVNANQFSSNNEEDINLQRDRSFGKPGDFPRSRTLPNSVKRNDSYSSGKSRSSSSGGETTLLCPTNVTASKRKSKSSKRLRNRKSCPPPLSDTQMKTGTLPHRNTEFASETIG